MMYNIGVDETSAPYLHLEETMKVTIVMRGTLGKAFGAEEKIVEVPENCTVDEALQVIGINYREVKNFGFVSVNNMRVMISDPVNEGDYIKAFSKVSGG